MNLGSFAKQSNHSEGCLRHICRQNVSNVQTTASNGIVSSITPSIFGEPTRMWKADVQVIEEGLQDFQVSRSETVFILPRCLLLWPLEYASMMFLCRQLVFSSSGYFWTPTVKDRYDRSGFFSSHLIQERNVNNFCVWEVDATKASLH